MSMNIVIRDKRKEIGLTQEQIAEYLGVTAPAVNKWEKGTTYPDISLLPPLARLLKIDLNTLLCFNEGLSEKEIGYFSNEVVEAIRKNGYESGFTMAMDKIQEYPSCDALIQTMAMTLEGALMLYGIEIEDKEPYRKQITALYERAAKSDDEQVRNKAIYMLISKYMNQMEDEKAQAMLELLPDRSDLDKRFFMAKLLVRQNKYAEAAGLLERKLLQEVNEIYGILVNLVKIELKEGNSQNASRLGEINGKFSELFELWGMNRFIIPLEIALEQKKVEESISLLKSMLSAMLIPWELKKIPLYRHIFITVEGKEEEKKEDTKDYGKQLLPVTLSAMESSTEYDFLRTNKEFLELIEEYRVKC
ncbi:helix-turn-helix transcriptional regulator [Anaerocolumna sp. AGMB13025]|uniref:helix-turn-helix domain-containing protein n=1 Tax=Anaerocolumna sp. AGMB13025 TaxID=3039116 RepID=UPI00242002A5|nr:helix-turn-helix transcriptional regulator [Anaerocolumna sp. AGMB13025]WFR58309.1 helix-turn-helix transcriptional regulator [Anaerocolumna sp. AGMB13025]